MFRLSYNLFATNFCCLLNAVYDRVYDSDLSQVIPKCYISKIKRQKHSLKLSFFTFVMMTMNVKGLQAKFSFIENFCGP